MKNLRYIAVIFLIISFTAQAQVSQLKKDIETNGNYEIFLKLLLKPEISNLIESQKNLTLVIPNDAAFELFLKDNGMSMKELENYYKLEMLVLNHMAINQKIDSSSNTSFKALSGLRSNLTNASNDYLQTETNITLIPSNKVLDSSYKVSYLQGSNCFDTPSLASKKRASSSNQLVTLD